MDFMDNVFDDSVFGVFRELPLYQALYQSEERAFQELDKLQEPLSHQDSVRCLHKAMLDCSFELFRKILEHSAEGEYTDQYYFPRHALGWGIRGHGSLVTVAAMMERPRHAQLLLEHGYDANGSGLAIADYLRQDGKHWGDAVPPYARCCGSAGCQIQVLRPKTRDIAISCVTPLVAALLCGNLQTAEVLLRRKDVWKEESTAVCRAAAIVLEGLAAPALPEAHRRCQLEILRQIFCPELEALPDRQTFLRSIYLQPSSFVDICRTSTLRCQLESGLCTEQDAREMLEVLSASMWWQPGITDKRTAGKLLLLKQYFPNLCRVGWAAGIFLREIVLRIREKLPYKTLLNAWKQLCGKERDLTTIGGNLWLLSWKELKCFLKEAGEGGTLVMDADALDRWFGASYRCMLEILKNVHFRHRDGEGVSSLIQYLLMSGDLRLLRQAANLGLLEREDPKQLMQCLVELENVRQDVRAMVLTYARNQSSQNEETANWKEPYRWNHWCQWEMLDETAGQALLRKYLYEDQDKDECLRTMFRLYQYLKRGVFAPDMALEHPRYPTLEADSMAAFACCAESGQPMKLLLEHQPLELRRVLGADWGEKLFFRGTALTLAAAMGRTEQVQLLLAAGFHPDELGRGDVSRFYVRNPDYSENGFPVTPVLAAILFGQEETAKMLLDAGASCDFSRPEHLKVLMQGSFESLKLAERLPDVGFEKIPQEVRKAMRIMTAKQGERTCFWNGLQQHPDFPEF